jgi:molecular chaperone GrpE
MKEKNINIEDTEEKTDEMAVNESSDEVAEQTESVNADDAENAESTDNAENDECSELEKLQAEIEELKKQALYKAAEFDNYRKRTLKERAELILNGGEKTITALLPVIDDMERALQNGEKTDDPQVLREGMELIYQKLMKVLEAQGVKKIDTQDADFDTNLHEAVALVPGMGDDKKGKVIDCMATGYKLNDKVIRYAKVAVGQ